MGVEGWAAVIASAAIQIAGLVQSNRLLSYRLTQLEARVNQHNNIIERLYKIEERAKSHAHRIEALETERR